MTLTSSTSIPLNKVSAGTATFARPPEPIAALADLAASNSAHGLLSNLIVRKARNNTSAVVAGGPRAAGTQNICRAAPHPSPSDQNARRFFFC